MLPTSISGLKGLNTDSVFENVKSSLESAIITTEHNIKSYESLVKNLESSKLISKIIDAEFTNHYLKATIIADKFGKKCVITIHDNEEQIECIVKIGPSYTKNYVTSHNMENIFAFITKTINNYENFN